MHLPLIFVVVLSVEVLHCRVGALLLVWDSICGIVAHGGHFIRQILRFLCVVGRERRSVYRRIRVHGLLLLYCRHGTYPVLVASMVQAARVVWLIGNLQPVGVAIDWLPG